MQTNPPPLEVWAPYAGSVKAVVDGDIVALDKDPSRQDWWISSSTIEACSRYGFLLDETGPLPDPRSQSQPDGVHGLSEIIDHSQFQWTDSSWHPPKWHHAVIYELHVGTFSSEGTFESAIAHLKSLVRLGITHVELMPVSEFPGSRGWGYDAASIYAPHHAYGGVEGLKTLVNACHSLGLAVILDVVYNHPGPDGNYLPQYGPYFTSKYPTPWGEGPNLDGDKSMEVRRYFIDNAIMWLRDYHIDGLRLDAIDKITDLSPKHFLIELKEAVSSVEMETKVSRVLIAESASNDPIYVFPLEEGGYGMTAQWNDDYHHSCRTTFTEEKEGYYVDYEGFPDWITALRQGFVFDGRYSPFRGKMHGKSPRGLEPCTFINYLQSHDQIGNRPQGDRLHHHPNVGRLQQEIAAAFTFLSPYTPMIFMGEEWAASTPFLYFSNHTDPALGEAVSKGRRQEFEGSSWTEDVPDPQDEETFLRSKLKWEERHSGEHCRILGWYTELLSLRKRIQGRNGVHCETPELTVDPVGCWMSMRRDTYRIVASLSCGLVQTSIPAPADAAVVLQAGFPRITDDGFLAFDGNGIMIYREHSEK